MTKEEAIEWLKSLNYCDGEETQEVAQAIDMAIKALEQQPSDDCVSRAEVDKLCVRYLKSPTDDHVAFYEEFCSLPPVTPTHGTCKDCKHWKDSDGVYRRGIGAESKCPINIKEVYEGNFYCKDFEKRGDSNGND